MLVRVGIDEYLNLDNVMKFKIVQENECYKLLIFGRDGKPCNNIMFFKNNEEHIKILNEFLGAVKEVTYNPVVSDEGLHYITDEDFRLLAEIKNTMVQETSFKYKDGVVIASNGKYYYEADNEKVEISKEQFALYYNISKTMNKPKEVEDE